MNKDYCFDCQKVHKEEASEEERKYYIYDKLGFEGEEKGDFYLCSNCEGINYTICRGCVGISNEMNCIVKNENMRTLFLKSNKYNGFLLDYQNIDIYIGCLEKMRDSGYVYQDEDGDWIEG